MTLEEACLILNIKCKDDFREDFIDSQFDKWYDPTKQISPYLADRIEAAYTRLKEEMNS